MITTAPSNTSLYTAVFPEDVAVVIIMYNARERIIPTIEGLLAAGCPQDRITIVDNASTDGGAVMVSYDYPSINFIHHDQNWGVNTARNAGILNSNLPYVLLMDDDILLYPDTAPLLRQAFDGNPLVAAVCPLFLDGSRGEMDRILYAEVNLHYVCEAINLWQGRLAHEYEAVTKEVGVAPGGALMISRQVALQVGMFDENYFIGKADGDFSQALRIAGYKILNVPSARALHNGQERGSKRYFYQIRNRWYCMLKNYELRTLFWLSPILFLHELLEFGLLTVNGHALTYFKAIGGLVKMFPALRKARKNISKQRACKDREILKSGPILMQQKLLANPFIRTSKMLYERFLNSYWLLLTKTVLK